MSKYFAWAKNPLIKRITHLDPNISMTVIYGKNCWMKQITVDEFIHARGGKGYTSVKVISTYLKKIFPNCLFIINVKFSIHIVLCFNKLTFLY